ncbi:hypothetical protein DL96DRAFT_1736837 [Flagelloscypha sp. PMI_526]|nr:hypothetical protein DL96DRAFT_1736837 [Flagelloscypha sp. PMI_526]
MFDMALHSQLHETYGAALVGLIVSSMIYGITNLQIAASIYGYLITNFALPAALVEFTWPMNVSWGICLDKIPLGSTFLEASNDNWGSNWSVTFDFRLLASNPMTGWIVTLVQWFFARQLWTSSKNLWVPISTALVSSLLHSRGSDSTSKAFHMHTFDHLQPFQWAISLALGATACADVMIVFLSCYHQFANGIVFASTNSIFTSMVILVLTTGLLMTALSVPSVILFVCSQTHYASLAFFWVSIRCHVTSFLAIHNVSHYVMAKAKSRSMSFHVATNATPQGPPGAIEIAVGDARSDESEPKSLVLNRSAMSSLSGSFQVPALLVQVHRSVCRDGEMIEP